PGRSLSDSVAYSAVFQLFRSTAREIDLCRGLGSLCGFKLHYQVIPPNLVVVADVGMVQCRYSPIFTLEAFGEALSGNLDSYFAVKARVPCAIDFHHPTLSDG